MRSLLSREEIRARLVEIFPREAFDAATNSPLASAAVAGLLYVDAVIQEGDEDPPESVWARPVSVLWMNDGTYARSDEESRRAWRAASLRGNAARAVADLHDIWGLTAQEASHWYRDTTREPLRDETFAFWRRDGAVREKPGMPTNSPKPRWALQSEFADLFDPALTGDALTSAIEAWRDSHLDTREKAKVAALDARRKTKHGVDVTMPDGKQRTLEAGDTSLILKGVIEDWAPNRLVDPHVLTISEPGQKVLIAERQMLQSIGVTIDEKTLLPDALIVDIGAKPIVIWAIEVVSTDGAITEERKEQLVEWAKQQRIDPDSLQFLTAFISRTAGPARKRLKDLAAGTYAWFLTEPKHELHWYEI